MSYHQVGTMPSAALTSDHLRDLKGRFARHIRLLGSRNTKGTKRYEYEVEFCYITNEIERGVEHARSKMFERANNLINDLLGQLKTDNVELAQ